MRPLSRSSRAALAAATALLAFARPSLAAWDPDPTTGARLIAGGPYDQRMSAAVTDNAGGAIILSTDYFPAAGGFKLMAARISATGNVLWTATLSPGQFDGGPYLVSAAPDGAGGALLIYRENRGVGYAVFAQRVNVSGGGLWGTGVAVTSLAGNQIPGGVVPDGAGGLIASWSDNRTGNFDVYAQRVISAGTVAWGTGLPVCLAGNDQIALQSCTDGAGGAIASWYDYRSGGADLYAARVTLAAGLPWTGSGVAVTSAQKFGGSYQSDYRGIAPDGSGGALLAWADGRLSGTFRYDLFVERLSSTGAALWGGGGHAVTSLNTDFTDLHTVPDNKGGMYLAWEDSRTNPQLLYVQRVDGVGSPRWTTNGIAVANAPADGAFALDAIADGAGGMIVSWTNIHVGGTNLYAQRYNVNGSALWGAGGMLVEDASSAYFFPRLVADGTGGAVVGFHDYRSSTGNQYEAKAQKLDRFGVRGDPAPAIARIRDVSADQGGRLALEWTASYLDIQSDPQIANYTLWRRVPTASAAAALARGARVDQPLEEGASVRQLRTTVFGAQTLYWELAGSTSARALPGYSAVMATTTDSLPGSNPRTSFMVAAETAGGAKWWFSAPDSGYSVDNIPPSSPGPFTGAFVAGATHLHWSPNSEADLAGYRVYRGTSAGFPADGAHLIASPPDTGYVDAAGSPYYYKLTAVDAHGNQSATVLLTPSSTTDVPAGFAELSLSAPWPNPVRGSQGSLRFALPAPGHVALALYDAQGRLSRVLADGAYAAGEHSVRLDVRDGAGRALEPGLYFARLTSAAGVRVTRFAIVE